MVGQPIEFQLIETMLWDNGIARLDFHLDRLCASSSYFNFSFSRREVADQIVRACVGLPSNECRRIRLLLSRSGKSIINITHIDAGPSLLRIVVADTATNSMDQFLGHKTTRREFYEEQLRLAKNNGFHEVLFVNERGELTEGAISNVFIRSQQRLFTPPQSCGLLPGVFRRYLLENDEITEERILTIQDLVLADAIFLCNSLRGLREVDLVAIKTRETGVSAAAPQWTTLWSK
jgi:para-aminobenzoate synthetase/4-amino-4-deoxychorismate lyase